MKIEISGNPKEIAELITGITSSAESEENENHVLKEQLDLLLNVSKRTIGRAVRELGI